MEWDRTNQVRFACLDWAVTSCTALAQCESTLQSLRVSFSLCPPECRSLIFAVQPVFFRKSMGFEDGGIVECCCGNLPEPPCTSVSSSGCGYVIGRVENIRHDGQRDLEAEISSGGA